MGPIYVISVSAFTLCVRFALLFAGGEEGRRLFAGDPLEVLTQSLNAPLLAVWPTSPPRSAEKEELRSAEVFSDVHSKPVEIRLGSSATLSVTEPTYASWNIDSSCNRGFHHISFSNPNLHAAARGLAPSTLRFGGSGNDNLVYGLSPGSPECKGIKTNTECGYFTPGCLNATHWDSLYDFSQSSGARFIFGVAFGLRQACAAGSSYEWKATNAALLLDYLVANGQQVFGFELGNEINNHAAGAPQSCNLTAEMQAAALRRFAPLARAKMPGVKLIGPDTGGFQPEEWLKAFLPLTDVGDGDSALYAVTHHVYPGLGRNGTNAFNRPEALDSTEAEIQWYTQLIGTLAPGAQIWAGEDGPVAGGNDGTCGIDSICAGFASSIWYADDMANRAKAGFAEYQRQSFFGGRYGLTASSRNPSRSLLGEKDALLLRPDYWTNFLWKRIIGREVLDAGSSSSRVRAYAFSGPAPSKYAETECAAGDAVQFLLINLENATSVRATFPGPAQRTDEYVAWILSPPSAEGQIDPFSTRVRLNGVLLPDIVDVQEADPRFLEAISVAGMRGKVAGGIELPPLSVAFMCFARLAIYWPKPDARFLQ
jgi:hypothetical protein